MEQVTFKDIKKSKEVNAYIYKGNSTLGVLGYTDHSAEHAVKVSSMAGKILECLGYGGHTVELAKIAGYMHDIGNCVNRLDHPHSGALMALWSSPVKVTDTDGDRFGAALEIWAYRSSKNTELVFTGRLNSDNGVKTKHIGADIKAGT